MGTEEGMDFGVSEHNNIQFDDLDDQFRREENGGDLLGISQQQINFAQPVGFNPQVCITNRGFNQQRLLCNKALHLPILVAAV
jgi:hypothetical protein